MDNCIIVDYKSKDQGIDISIAVGGSSYSVFGGLCDHLLYLSHYFAAVA